MSIFFIIFLHKTSIRLGEMYKNTVEQIFASPNYFIQKVTSPHLPENTTIF